MNCTLYIFEKIGKGYDQYPKDYSKNIFKKSISLARDHKNALVTHRDGKLMYYSFIFKLNSSPENSLFGFGCVFNDQCMTDVTKLLTVFQQAIASLCLKGNILQLNEHGEIISPITMSILYKHKDELEGLFASIRHGIQLSVSDRTFTKLPPVDYNISRNEVRILELDDLPITIYQATTSHSYTCVPLMDDVDTASLKGIRSLLDSVSQQLISFQLTNDELNRKYNKLLGKTRSYGIVISLIIILGLCGGVMYGGYEDLIERKNIISEQSVHINNQDSIINIRNSAIKSQKTKISELKSNIQNLNNSVTQKNNRIEQQQKEIDTLQQKINILNERLEKHSRW